MRTTASPYWEYFEPPAIFRSGLALAERAPAKNRYHCSCCSCGCRCRHCCVCHRCCRYCWQTVWAGPTSLPWPRRRRTRGCRSRRSENCLPHPIRAFPRRGSTAELLPLRPTCCHRHRRRCQSHACLSHGVLPVRSMAIAVVIAVIAFVAVIVIAVTAAIAAVAAPAPVMLGCRFFDECGHCCGRP